MKFAKSLADHHHLSTWSMGDEPMKNWIKATEFLRQHDKSDWHLASVERQLMSSLAREVYMKDA